MLKLGTDSSILPVLFSLVNLSKKSVDLASVFFTRLGIWFLD